MSVQPCHRPTRLVGRAAARDRAFDHSVGGCSLSLWGIGLVDDVNGHTRLLHDGRARSFLEAILWHGGEAAFASAAVQVMPTEEREALLAFLGSL